MTWKGFFSILHHLLGPTFDHKSFAENYRKIEQEFVKRIDPELGFFYWTGVNERYNTGPLDSFNEHKEGEVERLKKSNFPAERTPEFLWQTEPQFHRKVNCLCEHNFMLPRKYCLQDYWIAINVLKHGQLFVKSELKCQYSLTFRAALTTHGSHLPFLVIRTLI